MTFPGRVGVPRFGEAVGAVLPQRLEHLVVARCRVELDERTVDEADEVLHDVASVVPDVGAMQISFGGGVLEMHCAYAQGASGMFDDGRIREVLMAGL